MEIKPHSLDDEIAGISLVNDTAFKAAHHARYADMRCKGPIQRVRQPNGLNLYLVLDYDLGREVLRHPDLSKNPQTGRAALEASGVVVYQAARDGEGLGANMLTADPPDHARLRGPVARSFTPRRVEALRPRIQHIADELIDAIEGAVLAGNTIDLVEAYTGPLPVTTICELLGIPAEQRDNVREWTLGAISGSATPSQAQRDGMIALNRYLAQLLTIKAKAPGDDLLSELIRVNQEDGTVLSDAELLGTAVMLLIAGHETSVNLLGNAIAALLNRPNQADLLRDQPDLLPGAVEEFLRFDPPVDHTPLRFATRDLEIAGVHVPAGSPVVISLAAAGRDPATGSSGAQLDVTREDPKHISFGHGIHYCLGAPLARLEGVIGLGTFLRRLPALELAQPYASLAWTPSGIMHGPLALPVRIVPQPPARTGA